MTKSNVTHASFTPEQIADERLICLLGSIAEEVQKGNVTGLAVATLWSDGSVGTAYEMRYRKTSTFAIVGALEYLKQQVLDREVMDPSSDDLEK